MPNSIWNLSNLFDTNLGNNEFTKIPSSIKNLTKLTNLGFENNVELWNLNRWFGPWIGEIITQTWITLEWWSITIDTTWETLSINYTAP